MGLVCALLSCVRRRADRKRAPAAPGERFPRRRERYAESRSPLSSPSGHRADNRPQLTAHRKSSANHSARLRFPLAWLWVPVRASRASIDGENRAPPTPVRQAPRDNGPQRRSARQQQITGDANDAAGEDDGLSAIAVGQRPADDKHALLREGAQPEDQADKSPREQYVVARRKRARKGTTA